ncbi:ABC transporter ATP-binding protein [Phytohabitans sp. ZYX-F-186]|uniref:ABC transporter ATP-binding protein n=1 Tax=Phytohabitans maris TaxID=3071409 RepID=A0ABU0ZRW8_9ACTN|nr:ABC transporter ATP-binding protein [Phytohabitans sp. ZYX-F-186]MDQ7909754.1 ABC transporter ATP-binding protein [Phytohabitans sp. ZYX-F-186]
MIDPSTVRSPGRLGLRTVAGLLWRAGVLAWRAQPGSVLAQGALTILQGLLPVAAAWLTKLVIDGLSGDAGSGAVVTFALSLAAVGVLAVVVPHALRYAQNELGRSVTRLANRQLYDAVNRFVGLRRFEDPAFRGRLQLAETAGRQAPGQLLRTGLGVAQGAITMAGFLGTLLATSHWMALAVAAAALPTLRAELALSRGRADMLWQVNHSTRREFFYAQLLTSIQAVKEVRLFGLGGFLRGRMLRELATVHAANRRMDRRELGTQGLLGLLGALVAGTGLVWAISAARGGALTVGDVSVFVAAVAGTQAALGTIVGDTADAHHSVLTFDHYQAVVRAAPDLPLAAVPAPVAPLQRGIELRDVWFRYDDGHPWVLRGVNLTIPRGAAVALVGLNGAGKSTLVKLLCRFYDPARGSVHWDDTDLRVLSVEELRRRIGAVFQDFMTYELSARENIGFGDLASLGDEARVRGAARWARIDDGLASLPKGYDTLLTRTFFDEDDRADPDTGVFLSGGQWQRVALARAFLRDDPDLLILDEPSSGLDAEAEYDIHERLRRYRAGRTSVLISHRLSTVRDADLIVVLSGGEVVERGTHPELLALRGHYARLFDLQARGYAAQPPATVVGPRSAG